MNIRGLDKARVLMALYNASTTIAPVARMLGEVGQPMTLRRAREIYEGSPNKYFDYVNGRLIKVSLLTEELDFRLYDRDNGRGAGEMAVLEEFTRQQTRRPIYEGTYDPC